MLVSYKYKQTINCLDGFSDLEVTLDVPEKGWLSIKCDGLCDNCNNRSCFVNESFSQTTRLELYVDALNCVAEKIDALSRKLTEVSDKTKKMTIGEKIINYHVHGR